jgi:hypothetical protein
MYVVKSPTNQIHTFFCELHNTSETQRTHTHPYEYRHANPTPRSILEDYRQILKIAEVTTDASLSTGRRLPLKAQTPLNADKFAPTGSRTQELRCYLS